MSVQGKRHRHFSGKFGEPFPKGATRKGTRCPLCQGGFEGKKNTKKPNQRPEDRNTPNPRIRVKNETKNPANNDPSAACGSPQPPRGEGLSCLPHPGPAPPAFSAARAAPSGRGRAQSPPGPWRGGRREAPTSCCRTQRSIPGGAGHGPRGGAPSAVPRPPSAIAAASGEPPAAAAPHGAGPTPSQERHSPAGAPSRGCRRHHSTAADTRRLRPPREVTWRGGERGRCERTVEP